MSRKSINLHAMTPVQRQRRSRNLRRLDGARNLSVLLDKVTVEELDRVKAETGLSGLQIVTKLICGYGDDLIERWAEERS